MAFDFTAPPRRHAPMAAVTAVLLLLGPSHAFAGPELIANGNFDSWTVNGTASAASYIVTGGQTSGTGGATLAGWVNTGYSFVYASAGTVASTGAVITGPYRLNLWGPDGTTASTYSDNGFKASPIGGSFLAEDGAYQPGTVSQSITGLVVGQSYALSFYWAAAQQTGYTGATTEGWTVFWKDAGGNTVSTVSTAIANNASKGFTPWQQVAYTLVASTTTMTLSFLATGTPGGSPPFSLLDGVSLQASAALPEPASFALLAVAVVGGMFAQRCRRSQAPA